MNQSRKCVIMSQPGRRRRTPCVGPACRTGAAVLAWGFVLIAGASMLPAAGAPAAPA